MGLWGGIKDIGRRAGNWIGNEAGRVVAPIGSAIEGDWRGAASGIGRNIKRAGQAGALLGKDKLAGVDVGLLGAGGGAIEGGLGPSEIGREYFGDTGGGGFAGALHSGAKGLAGVAGAQTLHNIGERLGVNKQLGALTNKVGITSPDPSVRLEGETDEAFVDRVQRLKFEQAVAQRGMDGEPWRGTPEQRSQRARRLEEWVKNDPRSIKVGDRWLSGPAAQNLTPGSWGSGKLDEMIGEESAQLDKWNRENVPAAPDLGDLSIPENVIDPSSYMNAPGAVPTPASAQENMNAQAARFVRPAAVGPPRFGNPIMPRATTIPEDVIDPRSYMTAPAAVGPPVSARENMNARGVVPAARFGAQSAPGDVEMVGGPVSPGYGTNEYVPIPDASNIARATANEDSVYTGNPPPGWDMASRELQLASARENVKDQAARYHESLRSAPGLGDDTDSGPWWRQGLDYARENPDILINAAGQAMAGRAQDEYYRRMAAVNESNQRLRAQQQFYDQDPQRLLEQRALSYRSRWQ